MLGPTAHIDTFARDHLPPAEDWPDFLYSGFDYPEHLNVAVELTDRMVEKGFGDNVALIGHGRLRTYKELADWTNRLARALTEDLGIVPGNRILIRSANNPAMVACWIAAMKAGAVVINTVPSLRAADLGKAIDKAEVKLALCDTRLMDELIAAAKQSRFLKKVIGFDGTANFDAELDRIALEKPVRFDAVKTGRDDVAIIAFSTGATGEPKAAMHFHRDLLAIADGYAKEVLAITPSDVVVGTPPLAFTFGLGGLVVFPLRFGAAAVLFEEETPAVLAGEIKTYKATISFAAPGSLPAHSRAEAVRRGPRFAAGSRCRRARRCRRRPSRRGRSVSASRSSTASAGRRCCTSSSATAWATPPPAHRGARSPATRRASSATTCASCRRARSAGSRCAARPAADTSPTRASATTCATAGT